MSDLISRKLVLDKLKDFSDMYTLEEEARIVLETIVRIVTEQPTAYDISKVVAELEDLQCVNPFLTTTEYEHKAIEIARKGGAE